VPIEEWAAGSTAYLPALYSPHCPLCVPQTPHMANLPIPPIFLAHFAHLPIVPILPILEIFSTRSISQSCVVWKITWHVARRKARILKCADTQRRCGGHKRFELIFYQFTPRPNPSLGGMTYGIFKKRIGMIGITSYWPSDTRPWYWSGMGCQIHIHSIELRSFESSAAFLRPLSLKHKLKRGRVGEPH